MRGLGVVFFGAAVIFLLMLALLAYLALTGRVYQCSDGGIMCREGIGAVYMGLILLTGAVAGFTIARWLGSLDQAAPRSDSDTSA